ncbi:MAG: hypothetical protein MI923_02245 [Phycisphaerales bacterium]|nr:hypothetical protein [Phycisphaerales bacterium]
MRKRWACEGKGMPDGDGSVTRLERGLCSPRERPQHARAHPSLTVGALIGNNNVSSNQTPPHLRRS